MTSILALYYYCTGEYHWALWTRLSTPSCDLVSLNRNTVKHCSSLVTQHLVGSRPRRVKFILLCSIIELWGETVKVSIGYDLNQSTMDYRDHREMALPMNVYFCAVPSSYELKRLNCHFEMIWIITVQYCTVLYTLHLRRCHRRSNSIFEIYSGLCLRFTRARGQLDPWSVGNGRRLALEAQEEYAMAGDPCCESSDRVESGCSGSCSAQRTWSWVC